MASFALIDLQLKNKKANRDHTGGFGSFMVAEGFAGQIVSSLKKRLINLPVLHFGYTNSLLRQNGHSVNMYHSDCKGEDIIIIASSMHCYKDEIEYAQKMKDRFPNSKIGFFGPFVMTNKQYFENFSDFLIFGEIEASIQAYLNNEHDFHGVLDFGIVKDLNTLPIPDWTDHNISQYNYFPLLYKKPFMAIQSSRGCSFNCDFCPYMVEQTNRYRRRNPKLVVEEMKLLNKNYGVKSFLFRDICFTLNKKHAEQIAIGIIENNLDIEWACETRVDCLTKELIDKMYESGFRGVNLGIETGDNDILKDSGKKAPEISFQLEIIKYMMSKGIRVNAFYMLGLVEDTPSSMNKTINFAKNLNTMGAQFCIMTPFPGTPLFERLEDKLLTKDFTKFNEYQPVVEIPSSTPKEVSEAHKNAYGYYFRPKWMMSHSKQMAKMITRNFLGV